MSEMRALILRSLDRIVADTLDAHGRAVADGGAAFPNKLWAALDAQGMTAIGEIAEGDQGFADAMALVQRAAFHALPVPFGEAVVARRLLTRTGIEIPNGMLTVAPPGAGTRVSLMAGKLAGFAAAMPWGRQTAYAVIAASGHLVLLDVAGAVHRRDVNVAGEPRDTIDLAKAGMVASAPLADAARIVEAEGALLRAVQIAGALARVLELGLAWANDRVQFGRPIAKFQAVQHLMAQLAAETAAATAAADLAVDASINAADRFAVGVAKARAGEAAGKGAAIAHQVLGAMGYTREHSVHHATRRLWSWRDEFGAEVYWQAEIGRDVARAGADRLWTRLTEQG